MPISIVWSYIYIYSVPIAVLRCTEGVKENEKTAFYM